MKQKQNDQEFVCEVNSKRFANAKCALVFLSIAGMLQHSIESGLLAVSISTLEKRFELQSTESGIIASSFDFASAWILVIIAFLGEDHHKTRFIGVGLMLAGFGSVLFSLPHFLAPEYTFLEKETHNFCQNATEPNCAATSLRSYRFVFIAAMGFIGIGGSPLITLAVTFLDENVKKKNSALYNSIYYASAGLGPAVGFLLGGATLELYTYITVNAEELTINSTSGLWVGAWWLGFLICGTLLAINAVPLLLLPKTLPDTEHFRKNRNLEVQRSLVKRGVAGENNKRKSKLQLRLQALKLLAKNKPFIFMTLGTTVNNAFIYGFNTFGVKYLESSFGLTASRASLIYGITAVFAGTTGQIMSGAIISRLALDVRGILKFMVLCGVFSALCSLGFFIHCPDRQFAGGTVLYRNETNSRSPAALCNDDCGCSADIYEPVCADGITYFSPCFAGCAVQLNKTSFSGCTCLQSFEQVASSEFCDMAPCNLLIPFMFVVFFCFFSSIMTMPPAIQVVLRCVPFDNRTVAMAVQNAVVGILGILPGRILTGAVLDIACATWSTECGDRGSCRSYKRWELARNTAVLLLVQTSICVVFYCAVYVVYKPMNVQDIPDEQQEQDERRSQGPLPSKECHSTAVDVVQEAESEV